MLDGKDKVVTEGYTIYRNDRNGDGEGVLIAIKDVLKGIMVEESNSKEKEGRTCLAKFDEQQNQD